METTDYLAVFIDESNEHIKVLYDKLMELEEYSGDVEIIDEIFRSAHTLKGMSATMGFQDLANLTHIMENIFDGIKSEKIKVSTDLLDILFTAVDQLNDMIADISSGGDGEMNIQEITAVLEAIENGEKIQTANEEEQENTESKLSSMPELDEFELSVLTEAVEQGYTSFEITITLEQDCLLKGARVFMVFESLEKLGEVIKAMPSVNDLEEENFDHTFSLVFVSRSKKEEVKANIEKISEIESVTVHSFSVDQYKNKKEKEKPKAKQGKSGTSAEGAVKVNAGKTIRVNIDKLDVLMNLFEELVIDKGRLEQISNELNHKQLTETVEHMSRVSGDLQDTILTMRMVPIDHVFNRFSQNDPTVGKRFTKKSSN